MIRVEAALFFANADQIKSTATDMVRESTEAVVLDLESVPFIDLTGALMLQSLSAELAREEVKLAIARDVGQVEDLIRSTGMEELLDNAYVSIREAVAGVSSGSVSPTGESSHSSPGQ